MTRLEGLSLDGTKVTDAGLAHLKNMTGLVTLDLENTRRVSDAGMVHLKGLTGLRNLNLRGTAVTDAGTQDLQKALPELKVTH